LRKNFAVKLVSTTQEKPLQNNSSIPSNLYNLQNGQLSASQTISNFSSNPNNNNNNNNNNNSSTNPSITGSDVNSQSMNLTLDTNSSGYGGSNGMINSNPNINRPTKSETQIASLSDLENGKK
jgi:hypothetical protein